MLDLRWVREHHEELRRAAQLKHIAADVDGLLAADQEHRHALQKVEELRRSIKEESAAVGKLPPEERSQAGVAVRELKGALKAEEETERDLRARVQALALTMPQPPSSEVPEGKDDQQNVEIRTVGDRTAPDFPLLDHVALGEALRILDIPRAVKIAGTRNYVLRGMGARLELAVLRLAMDHMLDRGFTPVSVPTLVTDACMEGTGYYPGGEDQAYQVPEDKLSLVGTAEVSLTALHGDEYLEPSELPLRMVAQSPCYRREAGTYGKDTKGLYRVHQFWKVEQVVLGPNDEEWSIAEHHAMLGHAEALMQRLELPYRVVNVCGGDLGQGQVQKFDIETWMPSRGGYGETHSASRFHEFQARRLGLRYRDETGKPRFCHTLNNTVIASPRVLIALLENHQRADGSVAIPEALQPYLGGVEVLEPGS